MTIKGVGFIGKAKVIFALLGFNFFFVGDDITDSDDAGLVSDGSISEIIDAGNV